MPRRPPITPLGVPEESDATRAVAEQQAIDTAAPAGEPTAHHAQPGHDFDYGENLTRPALYRPYERTPDDPLYRPLRIYTSDPIQSSYEGAETILNVPYEPLEPGPVGAHIVVDDRDPIAGTAYPGVDLDDRSILINQGRKPSPGDVLFHQQMVYAVASDVIARFTLALGRDPSWGFRRDTGSQRDRLRLRPHFGDDANAYYDKGEGEIRFGYFAAEEKPGLGNLPRGTVYTCLSHDVIAHEMAHALLDGMRSHFAEPTNRDVLAFHEAFADLVAILQHFSHRESVRQTIGRGGSTLASSKIFSIAEQFGQATGLQGPLRVPLTSGEPILKYTDTTEPHELGSVLVGAVLEALETVFERRVKRLRTLYGLAPFGTTREFHPDLTDLLAEEAGKTAGQFLSLCVRALDYCPPVDVTFGEFLRALITADYDIVRDDRWGYREALIAAFGRREIFPSDVSDLSELSLLWNNPSTHLPPVPELTLTQLHLGADPGHSPPKEAIRRQAQALANVVTDRRYMREFGLVPDTANRPIIESVRTLRRVGPDRQVRFGIVAEVVQRVHVSVNGHMVDQLGGSTVILGGDGNIRFVIRKAADGLARATRAASFAASAKGGEQALAAARGHTWRMVHACRRQRVAASR